ncbi:MAG: hypothetical protein OXK80_00970 [Bdellovibrionales bacterium]|nr:hypothetical protein [Bdellovibrionales bacterium]
MYKFIISIIAFVICSQSFSAEEECYLSLVSSSGHVVLDRNERKRREALYTAEIQKKAAQFLQTIESLNLDAEVSSILWREHIYYVLDLVHYTSEQLQELGINKALIPHIREALLQRTLRLGMLFDHRLIQGSINQFNKKQKFLYDIFVHNVERMSSNLNRSEFKEKLQAELETLKRQYLYHPIEYHEGGVFGKIEHALQNDRTSYHNEGVRKWILNEVAVIMGFQGIKNQYEI